MNTKKLGRQTIRFANPPFIVGHGNAVGSKEAQGPLGNSFDTVFQDAMLGQKSWELAESEMQRLALATALTKAGISVAGLDYAFGGDLLNQCIATSFHIKSASVPFFGLYGACSTMAESIALAAMAIDGGFACKAAAITSSHFCTAERQYRQPIDYGAQRTPTAQWTATAAGALILSDSGAGPQVTLHTTGMVIDMDVKDANNMGAAMAPAAYETLSAFFADTGTQPSDYELILTGDLGSVGSALLYDLFIMDGVDISKMHNDCGLMLYDRKSQDVHAGGSGCGCSAAVLSGEILNGMRAGKWNKVLFAATGSLQSPTAVQQGSGIPSISHALCIENIKG